MKKHDERSSGKKNNHIRKNAVIISAVIILIVILTGCTNLLDMSITHITPHNAPPYVRPPIEQITVSDYDELIETILKLITEHETEVQLIYYQTEGEDVQAEISRAIHEIQFEHPIGAYAVARISAEATRIVTHFEIDIEIEYRRTQEQINSIVNAPTLRYMMTQLLNIMGEYRDEAVFRTRLQFTEEEITEFVREIYYQNPRRIIMMPAVAVEVFPEEGTDRVYEIKFGYIDDQSILLGYSENLELYVRQEAQRAAGTTDSEILLSLARGLIDSTEFDESTARSIHTHGAPNYAATAFGALVRGSAVGEGFAMAFKALSDELRFDNRIVLGYYDGMVHAWNVVLLYGYFYHIDIAMCVVNGIETAFLKSDTDFEEMYTWDRNNTVRCAGDLTLDDILGLNDLTDPDDPNGDPDDELDAGSDNEEDEL